MSGPLSALISVISYTTSSLVFTHYSRKISPLWVNTIVASIAIVCTISARFFLFENWSFNIANHGPFLLSGFLGIAIAEMCLLTAYTILGPGRTLVLFGFQPIILGVASYLMFDQKLNFSQWWSFLAFMGCFGVYAYEGLMEKGAWPIKGLALAFLGVMFDAMGILVAKVGFENSEITILEAHFYRTLVGLSCFLLFHVVFKKEFLPPIKKLVAKERYTLLVGGLIGGFLAFVFYLSAIKLGPLVLVSSVIITAPLFTTLWESIYFRKWPSKWHALALILFVLGMGLVGQRPGA